MFARFLLLILIFLISVNIAKAKETKYFDFKFEKSTLSSEDKAEVAFLYDFSEQVSEERFKIKPKTENGIISILENDVWIKGSKAWTEAAHLSKNIQIKLNGNFYKTYVWFEILDLRTGKIYKTPKHFVLSRNWYEDYIKRLNKIIFEYADNVTIVE